MRKRHGWKKWVLNQTASARSGHLQSSVFLCISGGAIERYLTSNASDLKYRRDYLYREKLADETSAYIKSGGAGGIVLVPAAIINLVLTIAVFVNVPLAIQLQLGAAPFWYSLAMSIGSVILGMSALLLALGAFGLWKLYKNPFPLAVGIIGILVTVFTYLLVPFLFFNIGIATILSIVSLILGGVFFILLGVAFILFRDVTGSSGLSMATGILSIIAGALLCSVIIAVVGLAMLVPTALCTAVIFLKLK